VRVVFFGTPEWAVPSLQALLRSDIEVLGVVTNPDRPAGRGYDLRPPPVKTEALAADLQVVQPERARDDDFRQWLESKDADACVVVAYGKILPMSLLEIPSLGFVNVHFSVLPLYRGAAPVQRAIMDGRKTSGVSIMRLTEGMDEGPVLSITEVDIHPDETAGELGPRLASVGAEILVESLLRYADGAMKPVEQDHEQATSAPKITGEEARIDWSDPCERIRDQVRGLNPMPGAWTLLNDQRLKVHRVRVASSRTSPGAVEVDDAGELVIGTGDGAVVIEEGQLAGKRRMSGSELARGLHLEGQVRAG
jgi:methionyl-tRNA formyltransferase